VEIVGVCTAGKGSFTEQNNRVKQKSDHIIGFEPAVSPAQYSMIAFQHGEFGGAQFHRPDQSNS